MARCLVLWVPIACHVQKEQALRTGVATHQDRPAIVEPTIAACTARAHTPFDLEAMAASFRNAPHQGPIPFVTKASFREDRGASFELGILRAAAGSPPDVRIHDEILHALCRQAPRNVVQDPVEHLQLFLAPAFPRHHAPVLPPNGGKWGETGEVARALVV